MRVGADENHFARPESKKNEGIGRSGTNFASIAEKESDMKKRNILAVALFTSMGLSGCTTLQNLNPFKNSKAIKAPCKVASAGDVQVVCEGKTINLDKPAPEELLQLRGPYKFPEYSGHSDYAP